MFGKSTTRNLVLSLGLGAMISAAAIAQTTASAASPAATAPSSAPSTPSLTKIGIVNINEAIITSNEGQRESEALQQKFSPKQAELKNMNDEVESLKKQYQAQQDKLSDEEKANKAKQIEAKQKSFQRNYEDFQNEAQQAEGEVLNRIGQKMMVVLDKYAKANGYAAVLDVSSTQTVLWANQGNVITKELVSAYNAEYPAGGPPAKPAGSITPKAPAAGAPRPGATTTPKKP
jgi:outer membrane protein